MKKKQTYWFKRRRYGWGWIPATWQGWAVLTAYLGIIIAASVLLDRSANTSSSDYPPELNIYFLVVLVATATLVAISFARGPRPKWRWGTRPDDNPDEDY